MPAATTTAATSASGGGAGRGPLHETVQAGHAHVVGAHHADAHGPAHRRRLTGHGDVAGAGGQQADGAALLRRRRPLGPHREHAAARVVCHRAALHAGERLRLLWGNAAAERDLAAGEQPRDDPHELLGRLALGVDDLGHSLAGRTGEVEAGVVAH